MFSDETPPTETVINKMYSSCITLLCGDLFTRTSNFRVKS